MKNLYETNEQYTFLKFGNKEAWRNNRYKHIGGSDAATLIGKNPWKDNHTLWLEKMGMIQAEDISNKPQVRYGVEAEPLLRELFKLDFPNHEVQYVDNCTLISNENPWQAYSPDGLLIEKETGRKGILEIKTTNIFMSGQYEKWNDSIPDNYYCQVLHGLIVTGFDFVVLKAQLKSERKGDLKLNTRHYLIERVNVQDDIKWLLEAEKEQYSKYYLTGEEPPTILDI